MGRYAYFTNTGMEWKFGFAVQESDAILKLGHHGLSPGIAILNILPQSRWDDMIEEEEDAETKQKMIRDREALRARWGHDDDDYTLNQPMWDEMDSEPEFADNYWTTGDYIYNWDYEIEFLKEGLEDLIDDFNNQWAELIPASKCARPETLTGYTYASFCEFMDDQVNLWQSEDPAVWDLGLLGAIIVQLHNLEQDETHLYVTWEW